MRQGIAFSMLAVACAGGPNEIGSRQHALEHEITPDEVDSADDDYAQDPHRVYSAAGGLGKLVVFLHGMGGIPSGYDEILLHANDLGFHVIGLSYQDATSRLDTLCDLDHNGTMTPSESTCWWQAHKEMWDCDAASSPFQIQSPTCIKDRLDSLLEHLATEPAYSGEGWAQFRENGHPRWPTIVLAGHSMGAGNAAWIAQRRDVHRLVMISQPADYVIGLLGSQPADWIDDGFQSLQPEDMYGLSHVNDTSALYARTMENWGVFGMSGQRCVAGTCNNPICAPSQGQYCGARKLYSTSTIGDPHSSPAQIESLYEDAWTYLLTHEL
jgi:pimeloyl-ACP methyl ester carboxylesterase